MLTHLRCPRRCAVFLLTGTKLALAAPPDEEPAASLRPDPPSASPGTSSLDPAGLGDARPGRAALAMGGMLALGTGWYWAYRGQNAVDWDNPNLEARISGEAWRLDNNGLAMNFLAHPFSGTAFYAVARAHALGVPLSSVYSFMTSFVWEYVVEFKEKVSINDVLVTPGAGIAMGEFFHKLALYVNRSDAPRTPAGSWLGFTTGPTVALAKSANGRHDPEGSDGVPTPLPDWIHRDFRFFYRYANSQRASQSPLDRHAWGFSGRLTQIEGYWQPGSFGRVLSDANLTELSVSVTHSSAGRGLELSADTLLAGYYAQSVSGSGAALRGSSAAVGTSIGYRFKDSHAAGQAERLGVLHLPGVAAEAHAAWNSFRMTLWARASADFAGVGSLAYPAWQKEFPDERPKAILLKKGYYYAWGASGRLRAAVAWGPWALRGWFDGGVYDSIEGLDRAKELVTVDLPASDVLRTLGFEIVLRPIDALELSAGLEQRRTLSKAGSRRAIASIHEYTLATSLAF